MPIQVVNLYIVTQISFFSTFTVAVVPPSSTSFLVKNFQNLLYDPFSFLLIRIQLFS